MIGRGATASDGSFAADTCTQTPFTCVGHVTIENDFVGYGYPSISLALRVLTSHELFHAVQNAYDGDQPIQWSEGSAVWAEEAVFPEQDDFEHLVAAFQAKPFRPFDRAGAGFGDLYPYGAGLWAYFLEAWAGTGVTAAAWTRCEDTGSDPPFLTELAHYEWVELALSLDDRDIDGIERDADGDVVEAAPLLSPLAWGFSYRWPVHRLGAEYQPTQMPEQPTHLVIVRSRRDEISFLELSPLANVLLDLLKERGW